MRAQTSAPPPLPPTAAYEGTWLGRVTAPNASTDIGFAFQRTPRGLMTTFYMPAMFLPGVPLGPAEVAPDHVAFAPLTTTLSRDGERLVGTFGLSHLPVELNRAEKFPPAPPAASPYPPGPAPRWSVPLGAESWASPVVHDGAIYVGTANGRLHARDARDGREIWTWRGTHPLYGTALVTATTVYALDERTDLIALDRTAGTLAWRTALHDAQLAGGPPKPNPTYNHRTATPVLLDGVIYAGSSDGCIYAVDAASGRVRWRHEAKSPIFAAPAVAGDALIFGCYDGTVLVLDRPTRREIVRTRLPGPIASPSVLAGNTIVVGCRDYMLYGLRRADLSVAWKFSYWFSWVESPPALVDGKVFIGGSDFARVTALDPATARADWSTVVHGLTWGTPLVTPQTVYAAASAQADAIIPHQGGIVALDRGTGVVRWRIALPFAPGATRAGVLGSLALANDLLIAAHFDGTLAAYPVAR